MEGWVKLVVDVGSCDRSKKTSWGAVTQDENGLFLACTASSSLGKICCVIVEGFGSLNQRANFRGGGGFSPNPTLWNSSP